MKTIKLYKPQYFGVNEVHTYQLADGIFFAGMNVQSEKKDKADKIMLMFDPEQIIEMYEFLLKSINK